MRPSLRRLEGRWFLTLLLVGAIAWSLASLDWGSGIIHSGGSSAAKSFISALFPPELSPDFLYRCLVASWQTVAYAVAGITLAVLIGLPLGIIASGTLASSPGQRLMAMTGTRFLLALLRSIHELVWAVLFVNAFGLSSLTAILALAIPYGGILGRIYADLFNDVPEAPLRALRAAGASPARVFLYGRLPMALPDMLSYSFYRLECAIRSAAIMSFIGIRGLGFEIQLALGDLLFSQVWTLLLFLLALVLAVDWWSGRVRRGLLT